MIYFKHARAFNFLNQKCSFQGVQFLTEELKFFVTFTSKEFFQVEEEFLLLQSLQYLDDSQLSEATIETDEDGDAKTYRIDIL